MVAGLGESNEDGGADWRGSFGPVGRILRGRVARVKLPTSAVARGLLLGVLAGVLSGLFGIGGGAVLVPLLVLWVAMPQHQAHATSLAAIILTAAWGTLSYALDGEVSYNAGSAIAAGAIVGAWFGAAIMHRLSPAALRLAFGVLIVVVAAEMLIGFTPSEEGWIALGGAAAVVGYVLVGVVAGGLSAVMGVGGGVIMVPAMVLLFGFGQHIAQGTSLFIIIPTAIIGAVRHSRHGYTQWRLGLILGLGGVVGATAGAALALQMDGDLLQRLFGAFLLATGIRLLLRRRERRPEPESVEVT